MFRAFLVSAGLKASANERRTGKQEAAGRGLGWWGLGMLGALVALGGGYLVWPKGPVASGSDRPQVRSAANEFAAYGGSASCRSCHEEEYRLWEGSHHALAERPVRADMDRSAFDPSRRFTEGSETTSVSWTNSQAQVTCTGPAGKLETYPVQRVIGENPLRQFLVSFPGGRLQVLQAAWDPRSNQWFNVFGDEDRRPGEWGHWTGRGMNWNFMCASCHNTALRRNYDETNDTYHTTMAEAGVGCEACHGPLEAHNRWQQQFGNSARKDPTIRPLSKRQVLDNCGYCHARRTELAAGFTPGDDFQARCQLVTVDASPRFYADGQVHDEDYEYSAFLGSRMFGRGVTCTDCHEPHSMKPRLPGNWLCLRCHAGGDTNAPVINPATHSRHKVFGFGTNGQPTIVDLTRYASANIQETGGQCVNCHMPQTVYMQRHRRHDHGFTIPDPLLTRQFGIPNACNRCHQDKTPDWALQYCDQWYGTNMDRPTRRRAQVLAAAQKGEASARDGVVELLGREESAYWRAVEAGLLESWATQPGISSLLVRSLGDSNALVRAAAASALGPAVMTQAPGVVEALKRALQDAQRSVRVAAAGALGGQLEPGSPGGRDFEEYLANNTDEPSGQLEAGIYAYSRNDLPGALEHLRKAVAWDAFSAPMRQELAVVLSAANQPQAAVEELKQACQLAPRDGESHYKLALALNELGDLNGAVAELTRAVALEPHHAAAWYNLGLAQSAQDQPEQALDSLLHAEGADPQDARIPYARATILARLGRRDEAVAAAREALSLRPGFEEAEKLLQALGN